MTGSIKQRLGQEQGHARQLQSWLSRQFDGGETRKEAGLAKFFRWNYTPRYNFITHVSESRSHLSVGLADASLLDPGHRRDATASSHRKSAWNSADSSVSRGAHAFLGIRSGRECRHSASKARSAATKGRGWSTMTWCCASGSAIKGTLSSKTLNM